MDAFQSLSVATTGVTVTPSSACTRFGIGCQATSAANVLVNIPGLHCGGEWFPVYKGGYQEFICLKSITKVNLKGDGGTATVDGGVTQR